MWMFFHVPHSLCGLEMTVRPKLAHPECLGKLVRAPAMARVMMASVNVSKGGAVLGAKSGHVVDAVVMAHVTLK